MIKLSAFADEISVDLDEQIAVLTTERIAYLELRAVWGTNVLDLSDTQVDEIQRSLNANSIAVSAIGSPIGKVPIDSDWDSHLHRFERAVGLARRFNTRYIRIFSFYPPEAEIATGTVKWDQHREAVLWRLRELTARARAADLVLVHENEKEIYGDTVERCVDLMKSINDPHFRAIHDAANFIQCGQQPYPRGYEALKPWIDYMHVKDARGDGTVVVAGEGAAHWPALLQRLRADGYDGFLSLEPHLADAGRYHGFSGPELFRQASQALQGILRAMEWPYA